MTPFTVAAPIEKSGAGNDAFVDQPLTITAPVEPLSVAVPTNRVPVHAAVSDPVFDGSEMQVNVRVTCDGVIVPVTWTLAGLPHVVSTATGSVDGPPIPWLVNVVGLPVHALTFNGLSKWIFHDELPGVLPPPPPPPLGSIWVEPS